MPIDHDLHREIAYWRALLTRVAEDLEHAAGIEADAKRKSWLAGRAMRIRRRLHEGLPAAWGSAEYHAHMNPRTDPAAGGSQGS